MSYAGFGSDSCPSGSSFVKEYGQCMVDDTAKLGHGTQTSSGGGASSTSSAASGSFVVIIVGAVVLGIGYMLTGNR